VNAQFLVNLHVKLLAQWEIKFAKKTKQFKAAPCLGGELFFCMEGGLRFVNS
jgi:hypothetical protein